MDGIAAVQARVAEICQRFAPPAVPPAATAPTGDAFAAHLRTALGAVGPGADGAGIGGARAAGAAHARARQAPARPRAPPPRAPGPRAHARHQPRRTPAPAHV